jgi:hypothetical protein
MENENTTIEQIEITEETTYPKIYSSRAIWGFSIIFSSIFGGVLLMQNLKDTGRKKEGNLILLYSIIFTILTIYIVNLPEKPISNGAFLCNMVGGGILSYYFQKKYFPNEESYEKKTIWKPLIISIVITIPFVWALIYSM